MDGFIAKWSASCAAERANEDAFLIELCEVLDVPRPAPSSAGSTSRNRGPFCRRPVVDLEHVADPLDLLGDDTRRGLLVLVAFVIAVLFRAQHANQKAGGFRGRADEGRTAPRQALLIVD